MYCEQKYSIKKRKGIMTKHKILFSTVILTSATIVMGMYVTSQQNEEITKYNQERRRFTEQWLREVSAGNYSVVEGGIKEIGPNSFTIAVSKDEVPGLFGTSWGSKALHNLKRNGYYAQKRGDKDNKYYMTLRALRKNGVDIGAPFAEFGDPVLDAEWF
jgi:hypothetical protein